MFANILRLTLLIIMAMTATSFVLAMAAALCFALVLLLFALLAAYIIAPEGFKTVWTTLKATVDGWFARLEKLWATVEEGLDIMGQRAMGGDKEERAQAAQTAQASNVSPKKEASDAFDVADVDVPHASEPSGTDRLPRA